MYQQYGNPVGHRVSWQTQISNELRELWFEHVMWTRSFIVSAANDLGDLDAVTQRLLRNPVDFAKVLRPIYGVQKAAMFESLLRDHILIAGALVNAAKEGNTQEADQQRRKWYANADEIAAFLHDINPYWNEGVWRKLLYEHLKMIENEAALILGGQYEKSIEQFGEIQAEAMEMADYMAYGIIRQSRA